MKPSTALATIILLMAKVAPSFSLDKSFHQAQRECLLYLNMSSSRWMEYAEIREFPDDRETKLLLRCIGLMLRFWDDYTGLQPAVIQNFFHPDGYDSEYLNRTTACLKQMLRTVPRTDELTLAYESFMCYYHQFGNLVVTPQFVPWTRRELLQFRFECSDFLKHSAKGGESCTQEALCKARCVLLQAELWDEGQGPLLDRAHLQFGQDEDEDVYIRKTVECIERIQPEDMQDDCAFANQVAKHCLIHGKATQYLYSIFD